MLTLTRKVGETIKIGDDIEIVVKEIRKNQVRIGIVAPREVKIYREEVYENIIAERRNAAKDRRERQPVVSRQQATRMKDIVRRGARKGVGRTMKDDVRVEPGSA